LDAMTFANLSSSRVNSCKFVGASGEPEALFLSIGAHFVYKICPAC
jgi:hypothetical protein